MKKILMLLLTVLFMSTVSVKEVRATEITDLGEVETYFFEEEFEELELPNKIKLKIGEDGKVFKITIPEFSYFAFWNDDAVVNFYDSENLKNKIAYDKVGSSGIFLKKGVYYIEFKNIGYDMINTMGDEDVQWTKDYEAKFYYGRTNLENLFHFKTEKKAKSFDINFTNLPGKPGFNAFGTDIADKFYYGVFYNFNFDSMEYISSKYKYNKDIKLMVYCENKKSQFSVNPSEEAKKYMNNIDTTKPTITGIKNNKTYKKAVTFKVSDESGIKKVTLNGKKVKVSKALNGYKIKRKSSTKSYTLKVWDKEGNMRQVKFKIKKK